MISAPVAVPPDPSAVGSREAKRERLHRAVIAASQRLMGSPGFSEAAQDFLAHIGQGLATHRVAFARLLPNPAGGRDCRLLHEWTVPGVPAQMADSALRQTPFAATPAELAAFLAGQPVQSRFEDLPSSLADPQRACGVRSGLAFPVFAAAEIWVLGVDDCQAARIWDEDEINFVRLATDAIAAAIERETAAQRRLDEQARIIALLTSVVTSSRELIEAADFEAGVAKWMASFGEANDASRATLYDTVTHPESGLPTWRMLKEWVRPGVRGSIPVSFAEPHIIDPRGAEDIFTSFSGTEIKVFHTRQVGGAVRRFLEEQGNASVVCVPILLDGNTWGYLSFDYPVERAAHETDFAVLRTAADTFATVLKRREALEEALREREARAEVAERSNRELRQRDALLKAVEESTRALLENPDFTAVLPAILAKIGAALGVHRISYFEERTSDGIAAHHVACEWTAPGFDTHATHDLGVIENACVASFIAPLHRGESVWNTLRDMPDKPARLAFGRLAVQSAGCVPILVEGRYHGAITFHECERERAWCDAEITSLTALANALAAALARCRSEQRALRAEHEQAAERERGEHARQAAVQAERTRLAGVIHDTLAQGFVGVLLQLEAAEEARSRGRHHVAETQTKKARDLARFGLAEARRSALAIYPLGEEHNALEAALHNLAERVFVPDRFRCEFRRLGEPRPLGREVSEVLLRLANEGINNALRHGQATRILVELLHTATATELQVIDNGQWRPGPLGRTGLGLRSLSDELCRLGGTLTVGPRDTGGTVLAARVELARTAITSPSRA